MSTERTIEDGPGHRLYADAAEPGLVYLYLGSVEFTATTRSLVVGIPVAVWEKIRAHGADEFRQWWDDDGEADDEADTTDGGC